MSRRPYRYPEDEAASWRETLGVAAAIGLAWVVLAGLCGGSDTASDHDCNPVQVSPYETICE